MEPNQTGELITKKTEEEVQIISKYSQHLVCRVCQNLFKKPTRLHPCGHTFCENCVDQDYVKLCPRCDEIIILKQNDLLACRLLADVKVQCMNEGCPWKGNYQQWSQFHKSSCSLRNGGLQAWLRNISQVVKKANFKLDSDSEAQKISKQNKQDQQKVETDQIQTLRPNSSIIKQIAMGNNNVKLHQNMNQGYQADNSLFYQKYLPQHMRTTKKPTNQILSKNQLSADSKPSAEFIHKYFGRRISKTDNFVQ